MVATQTCFINNPGFLVEDEPIFDEHNMFFRGVGSTTNQNPNLTSVDYFFFNWGVINFPEEPQNLPNHRVVDII